MKARDILLHICCGVCTSSVVEKLREENFEPTGFFYNPNVYPEEEYKRRLEAAFKVSEILKFKLIEGHYEKDKWGKLVLEFKDQEEVEGGKRCQLCFQIRLKECYQKSKELNISYFTTTLSASPHKDALMINHIGRGIGGESFLESNFKKKDGFKKGIEFSKRYNLYRQDYCGCTYSLRR
ncbi:epoxyqueuosine reductase QueH [bacterium]|nr:epoxyqueuosine reductase QueH [bacterium]MBU0899991.1 epoxyqueuosine reductase QueH [bacterium]MBU1152967.1 epoxyqueuosine reductase QueH [bacterium]MBU1781848.1 epoxyqueuosine reductase QueH [bacterium]MBU2599677.1 epoxyqueuosine reductase QueH [bacterium]